MDILKSRKAAAAVLAAVVIFFTPLGAVISLNRLAQNTQELFFSGVEAEGYTSASIQSHLDNRIKSALGLITVGSNYDSLADSTEALRQARGLLIEADTISEKYEANRALESAWTALYIAMDDAGLSAADRENANAYAKSLTDIQGAIKLNPYNEKAREYYDTVLSRFPANLFSGLIKNGPEIFGDTTND